MSTLGAYQDACGGYHEYTGGCSVHQRVTVSTLGVFSTLEGYHEYTGRFWYKSEKATARFRGFLFLHLLRQYRCICWPLKHWKDCQNMSVR